MDPIIPQIAQIVTPLIMAVVVYFTGREANDNARKAKNAAEGVAVKLNSTTAATSDKLVEIHGLVNSQLSDAVERFDMAKDEITKLKGELVKLQEELHALASQPA